MNRECYKLEGLTFSYTATWDDGAGKEKAITANIESTMHRIVSRERRPIMWELSCEQMELRAEVVRDFLQDNITFAAYVQMNMWLDDWKKVLMVDFKIPINTSSIHDFLFIIRLEELWKEFEDKKITEEVILDRLEDVYEVVLEESQNG